MVTKLHRQQRLLELLDSNEFSEQEQICAQMNREGFDVTQATISRDLQELAVAKVRGRYVVSRPIDGAGDTDELQLINSAEPVGANLIVLKTKIGAAPIVGLRLDQMGLTGLAGTISGDDTIFAAVYDRSAQGRVLRMLAQAGVQVKGEHVSPDKG